MATQWFRAGIANPEYRTTTFRYAGGILTAQTLWVLWLFFWSHNHYSFLILGIIWVLELLVPVFAERAKTTTWHAHHITERYNLFTLVILGEGLLGSFNAILEGLQETEILVRLSAVAVLALLGTAALWWIYLWAPHHQQIPTFASSIRYGYTHFFVFASAAAFTAGIELLVDVETHHSHLTEHGASLAIALPISVFLLGIWFVVIRHLKDRVVDAAMLLGAILVFADVFIPFPAVWTICVLIAIVAILVSRQKSGQE